jgi:Protein of unknown function (DUF742)
MNPRPLEHEDPDRLYTVTGGRSRADENSFDLVTLIVSECDSAAGMPSEYVRIIEMCARPMAVAEISAALRLPISVVKILLCDLVDAGQVTIRNPAAAAPAQLPDPKTLKQVLVGLRKL